VALAHAMMVIGRSMAPGFARIDNDLYYKEKTMMLFGEARAVVVDVVGALSHSAAA
jgi:NAD(P) transhydrogenase subunit beta